MDEILQAPERELPRLRGTRRKSVSPPSGPGDLPERAGTLLRELMVSGASAFRMLRLQSARVYHRACSATVERPKAGPLPFLALSAVIGIGSVVGTLYTPAYVVAVDGTDVGVVRSAKVFEQAEARVESRVSRILGQNYTLDRDVSYEQVLTGRDNITPVADIETYLFNSIGEISKNYVLTVDGQFVGAATDRTTLEQLLSDLSAPYVDATTTSVSYTKSVNIAAEYTPANVLKDTAAMMTALTANTNGQTTYEVQKGDTFMALAFNNGMTMAEMEALNPDVDVNKLYIGQLLNIKEEVPFLGIQTVDRLTYTEEIPCEVQQVDDNSMYQGQSKVLDAGIPGEAQVTADVTSVNGVERERDVVTTTTLREATQKVIAVGTKVRPSWYPTGNFSWPTYGRITSPFGYRYIFGSYSFHSGIDIAVSYGSTIKASDGGTVTFSGYKGSYGYLVIIDHGNGEQSYYGHNSQLLVSAGDKVYQGQAIARAGSTGRSTGTHCHFEIRINGTAVNPLPYLN